MSARLDEKLILTDSLLRRFYASERRQPMPLHPLEKIRLLADGAVLGGSPGNEKIFDLVNDALTKSPAEIRAFVVVWYATNDPVSLKADRLGCSKSQIYIELKSALSYLRGRFHAVGLDV